MCNKPLNSDPAAHDIPCVCGQPLTEIDNSETNDISGEAKQLISSEKDGQSHKMGACHDEIAISLNHAIEIGEKLFFRLQDTEKRIADLEEALTAFSGSQGVEGIRTMKDLIKLTMDKNTKLEQKYIMEQVQLPIIMDCISLYDRIDDSQKHCPPEPQQFRTLLQSFKDELVKHILGRRDVTVIEAISTKLDPDFQETIGSLTTNNSDDNGTISIEKDGFRFQGRVIRPQKVYIKKYEKEADNGNSTGD